MTNFKQFLPPVLGAFAAGVGGLLAFIILFALDPAFPAVWMGVFVAAMALAAGLIVGFTVHAAVKKRN